MRRSGKRNDLCKGHTDILSKVENGKQLSKTGAFQEFDAVFKRKRQMYAKRNKMTQFSFSLKQTQFNPKEEATIFVRNVGVRSKD